MNDQSSLRLLARLSGGVAAAALLACGTVADPPPSDTATAVYDVTTALDTFDYEVAATSPDQCPSSGMYCTYQKPYSGASLSGSLTLTTTKDTMTASGDFSGQFCDNWDASGCKSVAPLGGHYIDYGSVVQVTGSDTTVVATVASTGLISLRGKAKGDSITGEVTWRKSLGSRYPTSHTGTFVARRRPN